MAKAKKPIVKKEVINEDVKIETDNSKVIKTLEEKVNILDQENKGLKIELDHFKREYEFNKNSNLENLEIISELKSQIENLTTKKEVAKETPKSKSIANNKPVPTQIQGGFEKTKNKYGIEIIKKIK